MSYFHFLKKDAVNLSTTSPPSNLGTICDQAYLNVQGRGECEEACVEAMKSGCKYNKNIWPDFNPKLDPDFNSEDMDTANCDAWSACCTIGIACGNEPNRLEQKIENLEQKIDNIEKNLEEKIEQEFEELAENMIDSLVEENDDLGRQQFDQSSVEEGNPWQFDQSKVDEFDALNKGFESRDGYMMDVKR